MLTVLSQCKMLKTRDNCLVYDNYKMIILYVCEWERDVFNVLVKYAHIFISGLKWTCILFWWIIPDLALKIQATKAKAKEANDTAVDVLNRLKDMNLNLMGLKKNYSKLEDDVKKTNNLIKDPERNSTISKRNTSSQRLSLLYSNVPFITILSYFPPCLIFNINSNKYVYPWLSSFICDWNILAGFSMTLSFLWSFLKLNRIKRSLWKLD